VRHCNKRSRQSSRCALVPVISQTVRARTACRQARRHLGQPVVNLGVGTSCRLVARNVGVTALCCVQRRTVAYSADMVREGVNGSSPLEGLKKGPQCGPFAFLEFLDFCDQSGWSTSERRRGRMHLVIAFRPRRALPELAPRPESIRDRCVM
jgi:hypothetical protein